MGLAEADELMSTAPRGEGRWSGRMNPHHRSSFTRLGLGGYEIQGGSVGVGGWGKGNEVQDEAYGGEARERFVDYDSDSMLVGVSK